MLEAIEQEIRIRYHVMQMSRLWPEDQFFQGASMADRQCIRGLFRLRRLAKSLNCIECVRFYAS